MRHRDQTITALARLGVANHHIRQLLRASATLHTWAEHECNGAIQRDEETEVPYWHSTHDGKRLSLASDREAGALKSAQKIASEYGLKVYHQGDPRGCALYVYRQADLDAFASRVFRPEQRNEAHIDSCYNSVGTAVVP